jgi:hypothetical protein
MPWIKDFLKNIGVITTSTQLHEKLGLIYHWSGDLPPSLGFFGQNSDAFVLVSIFFYYLRHILLPSKLNIF